ncbi:RsmB/NOP family class I SAM-dependent RNA methyltransferase [Deferribacter abyssi]|uniref:RsmB/NOP family class I SAM-dependent RNA methyltransferase n=1 Tax=Deferribacter abyssi TaxID=213806 RepID=UPI003C2603A8
MEKIKQISLLLKKIYHEKILARKVIDDFIRKQNLNSKERRKLSDFLYDCIRYIGYVRSQNFQITFDEISRLKSEEFTPDIDTLVTLFGFNEEIAKKILVSINPKDFKLFLRRAPLTIRANMLKTTREKLYLEYSKKLKKYELKFTEYSPYGLQFDNHINAKTLNKFKKGYFEIQDEASQIITFLVPAKPGNNILDICAGSGGKSLSLASHFYNSVNIDAYDIDKKKLEILKKRAKLTDAKINITKKPKSFYYDVVLMDAPCSGLGTWRRDVDLNIRTTENSLNKKIELQRKIFDNSLKAAKKGGYIVYVTCSFLVDENEMQVDYFLKKYKNKIELISVSESLDPKYYSKLIVNNFFKTSPAQNDMDSFFGAIFKKTI